MSDPLNKLLLLTVTMWTLYIPCRIVCESRVPAGGGILGVTGTSGGRA